MFIAQLERPVGHRSGRFGLIGLALLVTAACAEPTGPGTRDEALAFAVEPTAAGARTAAIRRLSLSSRTVILDATPVPYTVTMRNPTLIAMPEMFLQGEIVQAGGYRGAGGINVECGAGQGILPAGTCTMEWTVATSNESGGEGTLVPGSAEFVLTLYQGFSNPVAQDVARARVTLVAP